MKELLTKNNAINKNKFLNLKEMIKQRKKDILKNKTEIDSLTYSKES